MNLKQKHAALMAEARELVVAAKSATDGATEAQIAAIEAKQAEIVEVKAAIDRAEKAAAFEAEFAAVPADVIDEAPAGKAPKGAKSLGEHFVKSAGAAFKNARSNNHVAFEAPEFKAATDVTTVGTRTYTDNDPQALGLDRRTPTITDLTSTGTLSGNTLAYTILEGREGDLAAVGEGQEKPKVHYTPVQVREGLSKIAGLTDVSDEMIEDEDYVVSLINSELVADLLLEEEDQLINGNGVYPNVRGILNRNGIQTEDSANADDDADAIFRAKQKVHTVTNRRATGLMINPVDYTRERLRKDGNGQYLAGGAFVGAYGTAYVDEPGLWGLPTVQSNAVPVGKAIVADFKAITVLRKGGVRVDRSAENKNNFETNTVTLRAEERIGLKVPKPAAIVVVNFFNSAAV